MASCNDPIVDIINSITKLSIVETPKLTTKQLVWQISYHKLDNLIDVITYLQRKNAKEELNLSHYNIYNKLMLLVMERKKSQII